MIEGLTSILYILYNMCLEKIESKIARREIGVSEHDVTEFQEGMIAQPIGDIDFPSGR